MPQLTHLDDTGAARMVNVAEKGVTEREAVAGATVRMQAETLALLLDGGHPKGDVFAVARVAGIQASKKCADLIPLCHPLMLSSVTVDFAPDLASNSVQVRARCTVCDRTGVEMEALTAASVAALTLYDMCKSADRGMVITDLQLMEKRGGRSGAWQRGAAGQDD
jgi:cyclic pyranopterin phosphate synthase